MFGTKKKKATETQTNEQQIALEKELEEIRRQREKSLDTGTSIMGFPSTHENSDDDSSPTPPIESYMHLADHSVPPSVIYHSCEDEEVQLFLVGDVAGIGTPAALIAMYLKGLFEHAAETYRISGSTSWIGKTLLLMNDLFLRKGPRGRFVTINIILIWKKSGTAYLWSMAGAPVHLFRKSTGKLKSYKISETPPMGLFDSDLLGMQGAPSSFGPKKVTLRRGDFLLIIGDGFAESSLPKSEGQSEVPTSEDGQESIEDEEFGEERVSKVLQAALTGGKVEIPDADGGKPWQMNMNEPSTSPKRTLLYLTAAEKLYRLTARDSSAGTSPSSERAAPEGPAKAPAELMELLQEVVESKPLAAEEWNPAESGYDASEAQRKKRISGYNEFPLVDEQFALAIRMI